MDFILDMLIGLAKLGGCIVGGILLLAILLFVVVGVDDFHSHMITGHELGYDKGYVEGQCDALNGKIIVEKVHTIEVWANGGQQESWKYVTTQPVPKR